jgi:ubiquinol-cytochrome c reductase cytochrome c1 subunit
MRKILRLTALLAVAGGLAAAAPAPLLAQEESPPLLHRSWPEDGIFGTFDRAMLQRGFQVFQTICQNCHSTEYLAFRSLEGLGYTEEQVKTIAAQYQVTDGPNDQGDMFQRPAKPSDLREGPFANPQAARAANGGALPPDLSLIIKALPGGNNFVYSILNGYTDPPADVKVPPGMHYNKFFPGHMIAMPPPLSDGVVTYEDGTKATVPQMAADVVEFLHWLAEPTLEERKQMGLKVILFLVVLAGLLYAYKRRIWSDLH